MGRFTNIWVAGFMLSCFFPFVKMIPFPTDLQPNVLLFIIPVWVLLGGFSEKIPLAMWILWVPVIFSAGLLIWIGQSLGSIRSAGNYAMLLSVAWTSYLIARKGHHLSPTSAGLIALIWGIVGLMQMRLDRSFLLTFLSRQNNSGMGGRGVVSLAPEPTMYAAVLFFLLIYVWHERQSLAAHFVSLLAMVQILILARSSTISLALAIFLIGLLVIDNLKKRRYIWIGLSALVTGASVWAAIHFGVPEPLKQTRPGFLASKIFSNPRSILTDESVNDRLSHVFFSVKGTLESRLEPHGFGNFAAYMSQQEKWKEVFPYLKPTDRIMSGLGAAFFETGWMGFFIITAIFLTTWHRFRERRLYGLFMGFLLTFTLFLSLPLGFPPIGFLLGVWAAHVPGGGARLRASDLPST